MCVCAVLKGMWADDREYRNESWVKGAQSSRVHERDAMLWMLERRDEWKAGRFEFGKKSLARDRDESALRSSLYLT